MSVYIRAEHQLYCLTLPINYSPRLVGAIIRTSEHVLRSVLQPFHGAHPHTPDSAHRSPILMTILYAVTEKIGKSHPSYWLRRDDACQPHLLPQPTRAQSGRGKQWMWVGTWCASSQSPVFCSSLNRCIFMYKYTYTHITWHILDALWCKQQ